MTLLNGLLALGALAFTIPLVIHLLFRNRFETLDWGAMRFLRNVVQQNRRRMQLLNLLLLLVRCLIPILLAMALARPVITWWRQTRGDEPVALAMILDNSYSMAARTGEQANRFTAALNAARTIAGSIARGSEITLLTSDGQTLLTSPVEIEAALQRVRIGGGPFDLESLLGRALVRLSDSSYASRQIAILSDNAAVGFTQAMLDNLPGLRERVAAVTPAPDVAWIDLIGDGPTPFRNLRLHSVEPDSQHAVPGQVVPWRIEARLDGPTPKTAEIVVRVNGAVQQRRTEPVRDNAVRAVVPVTIAKAGRHVVDVAIAASADPASGDWADDFPPDDSAAFPVTVFDPIEVWLVDGHPGNRPLASETDYLAIALSPFMTSPPAKDPLSDDPSLAGDPSLADDETAKPANLFRTVKVPFGRLATTQREGEWPEVVVLADVARPSAADAKWLAEFVAVRGGTLVVFAGPSVDPAWYEQNLRGQDNTPLLPMLYGSVQNSEAGLAIDETRLTYPPLAIFGGDEKGALTGTTFHGWLEMRTRAPSPADPSKATPATATASPTPGATTPPPADASDPAASESELATTVLRLEGGQPLIAVASSGTGQVVQFASTCDATWTTLPLRPAFVPLMQRLLLHLAIRSDARNVPAAGEPLVMRGLEPELTWTVTPPDGTPRALAAKRDPGVSPASGNNAAATAGDTAAQGDPVAVPAVTWADTSLAGPYRFEAGSDEIAWGAVRVPDADLKPGIVDQRTRRLAAQRLGATFHPSLDAFLGDDSNRRFGHGIWKYLLIALIAAMVIEPLIQQYRSRRG
jgi:hypothetical protein